MANQYRRGRQTEYLIKDILTEDGFICARTAGSHGPADIIAKRKKLTIFIQSKREKKRTKINKININNYMEDVDKLKTLISPDEDPKYYQYQLWIHLDKIGFYIYNVRLEEEPRLILGPFQ